VDTGCESVNSMWTTIAQQLRVSSLDLGWTITFIHYCYYV